MSDLDRPVSNCWCARGGLVGLILAARLVAGCAQPGGSDPVEESLSGKVPGEAARLDCAAITTANLQLRNAEITLSQSVPAKTDGATSENYPEHCQVQGRIDPRTGADGKPYAIGFEMRLPVSWNGKLLFQGGGGTDGAIIPALGLILGTSAATSNGLSLGYAVVSTDGGHTSESAPFIGGVLFGLDPQARIDYGYRALELSLVMAKYIVTRRYGAFPARSYFEGCSNGGRQGLVAAARLGDQFDGILVGDPGFNLPKAALQAAWDTQQLLPLSPASLAAAFSVADMSLVGRRIADQCDALDGAVDGIVSAVAACQAVFRLASDVPTCATAPDGMCLTLAQKAALQAMMDGPSNTAGQPLYARWLWDPGIAASAVGFSSWRMWKLENPILGGLSMNVALSGGSLSHIFTTPPTALGAGGPEVIIPRLIGYLASFNFDTDAPKIFTTTREFSESAMSFMTPPHPTSLAAFKARGKLIVFHGTADPVFSAADTVDWFTALTRAGNPDFARLYLVPGMGHCSGGMATDRFDLLTPLADWVERGIAPAAVNASLTPGNTDVPANWSPERTRPLCAYPKHAVALPGASDLESAASFVCRD